MDAVNVPKYYWREPDLRVGPLALWVHGYEFDTADDYFDANFLRCTALCNQAGEHVATTGSFLMTSDLHGWCTDLDRMQATSSNVASLEPLELDLEVRLTVTASGNIEGWLQMTPDPLTQSHTFRFEIEQSILPTIVDQLRAILQRWPVRLRP